MTKLSVFLAVLFATVSIPNTFANGPWEVRFQNMKMPSQAMLEHYVWASPVLGSTTLLLSAQVLPTIAAQQFTSFSAQPDFPRNIVISAGGSTNSFAAGTATVVGTNIFGKVISEDFTIASNQTGSVTGSKAFASVTSVYIPPTDGALAQVSVGVGQKLGIPRCMNNAGDYVFSEIGGVYETTRGTMAVGSTTVQSNTFTSNGTMDGSKNVDLFYVQNFRCYGN